MCVIHLNTGLYVLENGENCTFKEMCALHHDMSHIASSGS